MSKSMAVTLYSRTVRSPDVKAPGRGTVYGGLPCVRNGSKADIRLISAMGKKRTFAAEAEPLPKRRATETI